MTFAYRNSILCLVVSFATASIAHASKIETALDICAEYSDIASAGDRLAAGGWRAMTVADIPAYGLAVSDRALAMSPLVEGYEDIPASDRAAYFTRQKDQWFGARRLSLVGGLLDLGKDGDQDKIVNLFVDGENLRWLELTGQRGGCELHTYSAEDVDFLEEQGWSVEDTEFADLLTLRTDHDRTAYLRISPTGFPDRFGFATNLLAYVRVNPE